MGGRSPGKGGLKLRVLSFGKDRSGLFAPAASEYAERIARYVELECLELPAGHTPAAEAKSLFGRLATDERLVALDLRGKPLSSEALARYLGDERVRGGKLTFVIGGDEGLDGAVLARAAKVLQLSTLTLPHRLARVLLLEQLYRGFSLLRGEPYHK